MSKTHKTAPQQVRIIGGKWKRTPLPVLVAQGLRPTPDRVRETLFNWLHHLLHGTWNTVDCLDLFAGTGALGFEAASRGARQVTMFENTPQVFQQLEQTQQKLKAENIQLQRGDALLLANSLVKRQQQFQLIFLDPPFNQGFLPKMMPLCEQLLGTHAFLYVEAEFSLMAHQEQAWCSAWEVIRADQAGSVFFHVLQRRS